MTKKRFHTSLQLKLTLLLSLLMIVSCVLMYFFISILPYREWTDCRII